MKVIMLIVYLVNEPNFSMTMQSMEECNYVKERLSIELKDKLEGAKLECKEVTI